MRIFFYSLAFYLLCTHHPVIGQIELNTIDVELKLQETSVVEKSNKVNFFVVSKRKKGAFDLATRFNVFRSKIKSLFRKKSFVAIVARNGKEACEKIVYRLEKYKAVIGTLWFDSHGMYKKGHSLFFIGDDEYSHETLHDSSLATPLAKLRPYLQPESSIIIGSCYGGATYERPSIDYKDTTRMNGDSLMISLGNLLQQGNIYGSESWVMTKPGLFLKRAAVAGFPGRKLFRDVCYKPAWENVSKWNRYNPVTKEFTAVNTITLDMYGNVLIRDKLHAQKNQLQKNIQENLRKLQPGLYK